MSLIFKHVKQRLLFTQAWLQPVQSGYLYNFSPVQQHFLHDNVGRTCLTVEPYDTTEQLALYVPDKQRHAKI